jgi:predicted transposase YbfD/YdcC
VKSIVEIQSVRELYGKIETEKRYYISSLAANAEKILEATRQHWGIESAPQAHKLEVIMN